MTDRSQRVGRETVWTTDAPSLEIELPIPPRSLGKGASVHWRTVRRDYAQHQLWAASMLYRMFGLPGFRDVLRLPWPGARMDIEWRFAGIQPDDDNVVTRVACYRDAAENVELVSNDRDIHIGSVTFTRVKRADQGCVLTFTKEPA